jgi:hypothetical protein
MDEPAMNGDGGAKHRWPDPIVVSRPGAVLHTQIIPLEGELRDALTIGPLPARPPRPDSIIDENGYLKAPRLPRPDNLRWWERLAYAWRGL